MKEIYLIRHTTPDIKSGICYGATDLDVTDSFVSEVAEVKEAINNFSTDSVFSSPLIRCSKLASVLFPDNKVALDDRLKEMDFGDWEMKTWNSIDENIMKTWSADFANNPTPNGESFSHLYKRACDFIDTEAVSQKENSRIAVVTHSGIMRCLCSRYLHIPLNKVFRLKLNYGAVIKLTLHSDFEEVEFIK